MRFLDALAGIIVGLSLFYVLRTLNCLAPPPVTYDPVQRVTLEFDPRFSAQEVGEYMIGAAYWDCVGVKVGTEPGGKVIRVNSRKLPLGTIGRYERYTDGSISMDRFQLSFEQRHVRIGAFAHELGHAFGLEHMPDIDSVMFEYTSPVQHLSPLDVAQFNHVWHAEYDSDCPDVPGTVGP